MGQLPTSDERPRALYFGPANAESFGWLHGVREGAGAAPLGVVLCSTLGRKEVCSHHLMRHLAADLADAGVPALRFDYAGTGDASTPSPGSAGEAWLAGDGDLAHPGAWLASIGHAIDTLKSACGAARMPKARCSRSHAFSEQALAELGRMDLLAIPTAPAPEILVLERDDQAGRATAWIEHLRALGARVECRPLAGYDALMAPPYESVLPTAAIRDTVDWVRDLAARCERDAPGTPAQAAREAVGHAVLRLPVGQSAVAAITEEPCMVDPAIGLHGILTLPSRQAGVPAPTRAVVLLPAGADRRIGPGRIFVALARQLAAHGVVALRLDISGVGDSPARPGCGENVIYEPQALQDVDTAVRYVRDVLRIPDVALVGYCSSSYNSLKAAVAQTPVQALVLINQLVFFWKPGMNLHSPTSEAVVAYAARNYLRHFTQASRWRDLLCHPRKIAYAAQVLWRRPTTITQHVMRDVGRRLGFPLKDDLGRELLDLAHRKVSLHFIFASGDPGEALLRTSGGSVVRRLIRTGALRIDHIKGADHEFTQFAHRQQLQRMLHSLLVTLASPEAARSSAGAKETPESMLQVPLQGH